MDRYGNAQEILMDNVFNSLSDGPSFKHFDIELFTGRFDRARGISTEKPIARVLNPGYNNIHINFNFLRNFDFFIDVFFLSEQECVLWLVVISFHQFRTLESNERTLWFRNIEILIVLVHILDLFTLQSHTFHCFVLLVSRFCQF